MTIFAEPGVLEDVNWRRDRGPSLFANRGFEWYAPQAQNDQFTYPPDAYPLTAARSAGMRIVPWGVSYRADDFARDAATLGRQAAAYNAAAVIIDVEECLKGADFDPYVDALRAEWAGPAAVTTLGNPANPAPDGPDVYPFDYAAMKRLGLEVLPQVYPQDHPTYTLEAALAYWRFLGFEPRPMIGLHWQKYPTPSGLDWARDLWRNSVGPGFSVFMGQHGTVADWDALEAQTEKPPDHLAAARAELQAWARAQIAAGKSWAWVKAQPAWHAYRTDLGGT